MEKKLENVIEPLEKQEEITTTEEAMEKGGRWKQFAKKHKGKIIGGILIATGIGVTAFIVKKFINSPVNAANILEQAAEATESAADIIETQV